jgi:xylulokinase
VILTLDFGSSLTKAALWGPDGLVAWSGCGVETSHPQPGWSEQDPEAWWPALVDACAAVRTRAPEAFAAVDVVGCTGARQTVVVVGADGRTLGPGILWSDRRAASEVERLASELPGSGPSRGGPGTPLDAGSVAAKLAWVAAHEPAWLEAARWVLTPRDLMVARLTDTVATDATMASRSGLYDLDGRLVEPLVGAWASRLPPVVPSDRVTGPLTPGSAAALGLIPGTPVVIGAGDRACEVLGSGATESHPMVSWGTTANVSVPVGERPEQVPTGIVLSRSTEDGWLLEGGLSAAGSLLSWIGALTGHRPDELSEGAAQSPPGARGVVATPWLEGARAPWWRPDATVDVMGLQSVHGPADLARAAFEAVAWEVQRCLEAIAQRRPEGLSPAGVTLGGSGAGLGVWVDVLAGVTGLPSVGRRSGQAASAGAAILAARAVGGAGAAGLDLDHLDPVVHRTETDPDDVRCYRILRARSDRLATTMLALHRSSGADGGPEAEAAACR